MSVRPWCSSAQTVGRAITAADQLPSSVTTQRASCIELVMRGADSSLAGLLACMVVFQS